MALSHSMRAARPGRSARSTSTAELYDENSIRAKDYFHPYNCSCPTVVSRATEPVSFGATPHARPNTALKARTPTPIIRNRSPETQPTKRALAASDNNPMRPWAWNSKSNAGSATKSRVLELASEPYLTNSGMDVPTAAGKNRRDALFA